MNRAIDKIARKLEREFKMKFDNTSKKQLELFLEKIMFEKTL